MGVNQLVACLAVAAAGSLGGYALQADIAIGADPLREGVTFEDVPSDADLWPGSLQQIIDVAREGISPDEWRQLYGLPVVGMIMMKDANSVQFISLFPDDGRDVNSFYTSISQDPQKAVIFLFAVESDGLLLQAVDNAARDPVGKNMFLGAHDYDDTDRQFEGMIRVIVHSRENLAVIWEFVKVDDNTYIMVKENRDRTAKDTVGWYVAVPPDSKRDSESNYLAITNDIAKAMPVTTKFATPDIFHTPRA